MFALPGGSYPRATRQAQSPNPRRPVMGETFYCDNYEELTNRPREDTPAETVGTVETKVVEAPEQPEPEAADVQVETA